MTLVDTNVLLDILSTDAVWSAWSEQELAGRSIVGPLLINDVVYAEMSACLQSQTELDDILDDLQVEFTRIPLPALFLAGKAFRKYRTGGGIRTGVLPDFFIGAHAQVTGIPLLTRDIGRYRSYFPTVKLIAPGW